MICVKFMAKTYSMRILWIFYGYSMNVHCVFIAYSLHIHFTFTSYLTLFFISEQVLRKYYECLMIVLQNNINKNDIYE